MKKKVFLVVGSLILACVPILVIYSNSESDEHATCYGRSPCNACSSCNYCGHCAKLEVLVGFVNDYFEWLYKGPKIYIGLIWVGKFYIKT